MKNATLDNNSETQFSAWNPGIESQIPSAYRQLETIYRPENVFTSREQVDELTRETGLSHEELVAFKPARLALHELIIRVTADIVVLEGEQEEDLGIHFREIASHIHEQYILPQLDEIESSYQALHLRLLASVNAELEKTLFTPPTTPQKPGLMSRLKLFQPSKKPASKQESTAEKEFRVIASFREQGLNCTDPEQAAVFRSLYRVLGSIANTRGFIGRDQAQIATITARYATNYFGSRLIGERVADIVDYAIEQENYARIPDAQKPVLISLKGTSAAGKSSLRPMLQDMARELGIEDNGYGTISPDIWRRFLLDYDSLGEAYKYAGRLTSYEVNIVDSRLDSYIRRKAEQHRSIPHLVVDRFRFDSFSSEKISRILHKTYVAYIDTMYMYFVITPPEETVTRGWQRGLARGRYKSVEDFLGHCVEAYSGMPKLLFKWMAYKKPKYIFEFFDNSVPKGEFPITSARGTQSKLQIFDPLIFVDIERYQHINILATDAKSVYARKGSIVIEDNLDFLRQCIEKFPIVEFIDPVSNKSYLQTSSGEFEITDSETLNNLQSNVDLAKVFTLLVPGLVEA